MKYFTSEGIKMVERQIVCDNQNSLMAFEMRENTTDEKYKRKLTAYINKTQASVASQHRGLKKGYIRESNTPSVFSIEEFTKQQQ